MSDDKVTSAASRLRRGLRAFQGHEQFAGMVLLAVAFIIGSFAVASGIQNRYHTPTKVSHQITVTGSAQIQVTSNEFQWAAHVSATQPTTSAALSQISSWTTTIRSSLIHAGALPSEVSFTTLNVQPNTDTNGQVISFTMSEWVNVQSTRLAAMQPVLGVTTHLLALNIPFLARQPRYTYNGLKKLRPLLTKEAAANARLRAQDALGKSVHLGKPITISVGYISIDKPGNVNFNSGDFNTSSIPKVVSVVVYATYST